MYKRIDKTCEHCSSTYSGTKASKYCGYKCANESRKKRIRHTCLECEKEFETQSWYSDAKFCSVECKVLNKSSKMVTLDCTRCKKIFERKEHKIGKNNFCSHECSIEFNKGANHYEYKEHLHDKNYKTACKQWSMRIKEVAGYTCEECGEPRREVLEAHHLKHRSKSPELCFDFTNGVCLCLKCHASKHQDDPKSLRLITTKIRKFYG